MADNQDPFEILRKKLEARKRKDAGKGKPVPKHAPGRPAPKKSGWADERKSRPAPLKPAKPPPLKRPGSPAKNPAAKPPAPRSPRIIRNAWAAEDLQKMSQSREQVSGGTPAGFESHRYDSELDRAKKEKKKDEDKTHPPRPKGYRTDRHHRS